MIAAWLLFGCIIAEVVRELCFKAAAAPLDAALARRDWRAAASQHLIWIGIALWCGETLLWIGALGDVPLGIAYPLRAASFAIIPLMACLLLHERLRRGQMFGVALIVVGVGCVAASGL